MTPTARPFHLSDASIRVDSMPTAGRDLTLRVDAIRARRLTALAAVVATSANVAFYVRVMPPAVSST